MKFCISRGGLEEKAHPSHSEDSEELQVSVMAALCPGWRDGREEGNSRSGATNPTNGKGPLEEVVESTVIFK